MPLSPGESIAHYRVSGPLGVGGMGEVYRATDTNLKREVAIKVLPESVATDRERLARLQREAEVLAALNHPNIAQIHGLEASGGRHALVMELVEGPTLADRIAQGPLPFDEVRPIATQIAEALEAAHERGIIHRDLKPANIKVRDDGTVKVLDFGLAKALSPDAVSATAGGSAGASMSPTITSPAMTQTGLILGTAAYMAPEQAAGRPVDRRADIWSFGVVLWEMITGKRLFPGAEVAQILADVIRAPIDFSQVPAGPSRDLLMRCLDRDVRTRLRDIGEARIALDRPAATVTDSRRSAPSLAWVAAGVCAAIAAMLGFAYWRAPAAAPTALAVQLSLPEGATAVDLALSPDGRTLALTGSVDGIRQLWIRPLGSDDIQRIPQAQGASHPFWSPDGRYVGFFAGTTLNKMLASGGPPEVICDALNGRGATWNREGTILFSSDDGGGFAIRRVAAAGGTPEVEWKPSQGIARFPVFLPDGRHFLFVLTRAPAENNGIYYAELGTPERRRLLGDESSVTFASGNLLFIRANTLLAQPFDPARGETTGDPVPLAAGVLTTKFVIYAPVTAADGGALMYQKGGTPAGNSQLEWYNRAGTRLEVLGEPRPDFEPSLSPDGKSVVFMRLSRTGSDLWLWDVSRANERRLTLDPAFEVAPIWSPQGDRIVFRSNREGGIPNLYQQSLEVQGSEVQILRSPFRKTPAQWTRDGKWIVYTESDPKTRDDIWLLSMKGNTPGTPVVYLRSEFNEGHPQVSPDGRWLAHTSDESGRDEIYVRRFPDGARPQRISTGGGREARWRADGRELYYLGADSRLMAVAIEPATSPLEAGTPQFLFSTPSLARYTEGAFAYDVTSEGSRFLFVTTTNTGASSTLNVSLNWERR
jgi:Tol biopolymer transport system component